MSRSLCEDNTEMVSVGHHYTLYGDKTEILFIGNPQECFTSSNISVNGADDIIKDELERK